MKVKINNSQNVTLTNCSIDEVEGRHRSTDQYVEARLGTARLGQLLGLWTNYGNQK